jgi:hypothetical protein
MVAYAGRQCLQKDLDPALIEPTEGEMNVRRLAPALYDTILI